MGPRGRNKRNSSKHKNNKPKKRKTYSLYPDKNKGNQFNKRKQEDDRKPNLNEIIKRKKVEEIPTVHRDVSSESESEEEEDALTLLRNSLMPVTKKSAAIDTDDEDEDSVHEEDVVEGSKVETNENPKVEKEDCNSDTSGDEDNVEEDEEEIDVEIEKEENSENNLPEDPFTKHISYELHESLLESVQSKPMKTDNFTENWPELGTLAGQIPICAEIIAVKPKTVSIEGDKKYAPKGTIPKRINPSKDTPSSVHIKQQIEKHLRKANLGVLDEELVSNYKLPFTHLQAELFSIINNYQDLYFPERNFQNAEQVRYVYCLHAANHVLKTRIKVLHHNARLSSKDDVPEEYRDQGLVRPKVLIIVPFRDSAYRIINILTELFFLEDKGNVINKNRFIEDYTGHEIVMPKKNPKPDDYQEIFKGNSNDDFKIGITVTKKSLKLYANFYSSDIIIASPLGLRTTIGAEGEHDRDFDFLASIEILILDQIEIFPMQNIHHLFHIMEHLHIQPKAFHGTDFSRVRHWSLNGWAKYYRQTLIFSSMVMPEALSIFTKNCFNYAGRVRVSNPITTGSIKQVYVHLPHIFQKFEAESLAQSIDARFEFFTKSILPEIRDQAMEATLIFVPNYYDYVRVRNYFKRETVSFVQICEYTKDSKIARARDMFYHGDAHFLLYTERFHFFNRIRLKGIRHIVFYQPPMFSHLYSEICNLMTEINMNKKVGSMLYMTVTVIYCKYDIHQLNSIVGTEKAAKILQSDANIHKIITNST